MHLETMSKVSIDLPQLCAVETRLAKFNMLPKRDVNSKMWRQMPLLQAARSAAVKDQLHLHLSFVMSLIPSSCL